jgi:cytochrome c
MNSERGRKLFVDKGCVACHAINGVGGHDAPNMDAHDMPGQMSPFDFAAKMWNHASGMIAAQEGALGEQIYFTGGELADIIAFIHDDEAQHRFSETDLTTEARRMMHHEHGEMPAPKAHGQELGHHDDEPGTPPHKH